MDAVTLTPEEIAQRARVLFEHQIQPELFDRSLRDYVVMDIDSGDYEVGPNPTEVNRILLARHPGSRHLFGRYVGNEVSLKFGRLK